MRILLLSATLLLAACAPHARVHSDEWLYGSMASTWTPDEATIVQMKARFNEELEYRLNKSAVQSTTSARYWFQYRPYGTGEERALEIVGGPLPIPEDVDTVYYRPYVPEQCHITATYLRNSGQIADFVLGGFCPPRI